MIRSKRTLWAIRAYVCIITCGVAEAWKLNTPGGDGLHPLSITQPQAEYRELKQAAAESAVLRRVAARIRILCKRGGASIVTQNTDFT